MTNQNLTDRETWLKARKALLDEEKSFTKLRDALSAKRRELPMVLIEKRYSFDTANGVKQLEDLFGAHNQLIVYHFMFGKDWSEGCPSCSFWADNFNGTAAHLAARDTGFVCVSTAPLSALLAYRARMNWQFDWISSGGSDFNADFGVTFDNGELGPTNGYNYRAAVFGEEMPGLSVFVRLDDGTVAHSYSAYGRGLDMFNGAYHMLDATVKGRNEAQLTHPQAWVQRHDQYE